MTNVKLNSLWMAVVFPLLGPTFSPADEHEPVFPLKVSENHRYFVDQQGVPFFWLGTTQWQLFHNQTFEEARTILETARRNGANFVQVKLLGEGNGAVPCEFGGLPLHDGNPLTPNEEYFQHVDRIMEFARDINMGVALTVYHQKWGKLITEANARAYGKWVAQRYGHIPQIIWTSTPQAKPEYLVVLRELAAGIKSADPLTHLMTCKPNPAPFSSSFAHDEPWMDFNCIQVWNHIDLIYPFITKDYSRTPTKPVLMTEGAYEGGSDYYRMQAISLWVRRQGYYTVMLGAFHGFGHHSTWNLLPGRVESADAPGARQLGIMKRFFTDRKEWWLLVPDQSILATGSVINGNTLNLAARHKDGQWAIVYLAGQATFSVDMNKFAGGESMNASWIDPRTGQATTVGKIATHGTEEFTTPAGWEDAILLLERSGAS